MQSIEIQKAHSDIKCAFLLFFPIGVAGEAARSILPSFMQVPNSSLYQDAPGGQVWGATQSNPQVKSYPPGLCRECQDHSITNKSVQAPVP